MGKFQNRLKRLDKKSKGKLFLDSTMIFGRYKGTSIREIIDLDCVYMTWLCDENIILLENEAWTYLQDKGGDST